MFERWLPARERKTDTKLATKRSDDKKESDEVANCRKGIFLYRCQDETVPVKTKTTTRIYCYRTRNTQLYSDENVGSFFLFICYQYMKELSSCCFWFEVFFQEGLKKENPHNILSIKPWKHIKLRFFFWRYIKNRRIPSNTVHFHGAGCTKTFIFSIALFLTKPENDYWKNWTAC